MRRSVPMVPISRPRAVAVLTLLLPPLLGGCDWPTPPEVTVPPPVTWSTDSTAGGLYRVPVEGVVVDPFRAPEHPYGPGNRGIEYRTESGAAVRAARAGRVSFAGGVAGRLVVAIEHADGRRTTYSGLAAVSAARGDVVSAGHRIGTAGSTLHFGMKVGDAYVDPAPSFGPPAVVLLPDAPATD